MRLIDADEIPYKDLSEGHGFCWVTFWDWIKKMPTVDAVEVVRCKDCRYFKSSVCPLANIEEPQLNDYCSYGEKKES